MENAEKNLLGQIREIEVTTLDHKLNSKKYKTFKKLMLGPELRENPKISSKLQTNRAVEPTKNVINLR